MAFRPVKDLSIFISSKMNELIGFAIFMIAFTTLGMLTSACLMRRIDSLAHALEEADKKYTD